MPLNYRFRCNKCKEVCHVNGKSFQARSDCCNYYFHIEEISDNDKKDYEERDLSYMIEGFEE